MKRNFTGVAILACAFMASACTTTQKVSPVQPGDKNLSCAQLTAEFNKLDEIKKDADRDGGVNTANVAAVLFFWPAAVGNWMNARDARQLVEDRREHLMKIHESKNCDAAAA